MADFNANTDWAFTEYERVRDVLPSAAFPAQSQHVANLGALADHFDVFLLDAFGVLNVGETAIPSAPAQIAALQALGKTCFVLTNGAGLPPSASMIKYRRFGFEFTPETVISSREIMMMGMADYDVDHWGCMAMGKSALDQLPGKVSALGNDAELYDAVDGFILLSSMEWTAGRYEMLVKSLQNNPRPVIVGNPDLVAPREDGLSMEPGWTAHELARETGVVPKFYGKPFPEIFTEARKRIPAIIPDHRICMVGDTLHTDILGGKAAGFGTVLIADHGLFAGKDVSGYIEKSGIVPDFIAPTT